TIQEVARHRGWRLWAVHARTYHVHMVVTASASAEKVMSDVKAWCSRRLKERHGEAADRTRWTRHGSTRHLMSEEAVHGAARYVVLEQGEPTSVFYDPTLESYLIQEPEA